MSKHVLPVGIIIATSFWPAVAGEVKSKTINLGGLRQAKATVTASESEYVIQVSFIAVRSFDPLTNTRLNREKGRLLALQALAKHIAGDRPAQLSVSGAQVERTGAEGGRYTLTLRVPRGGLTLLRQGTEPRPPEPGGKVDAERVTFSSTLFTRKGEYLQTLDQLDMAVTSDLRRAIRQAKADEAGDESFTFAIAELEERALGNLKKLGGEIDKDLLLLTTEKEELLGAVERQKQHVLDRLKEAVKKQEGRESKEKSP
jgi:hypothetical protein